MKDQVDTRVSGSGLVWPIVLTGIALPWVCGAGVKIYLDFSGMPTWPWSAFLSPVQLVFLLAATAWISLPFFLLAYAAKKLLPVDFLGLVTPRARSAFFIGGLVGGSLGAVWVFVRMFWWFDFLELLMPQWLDYLPQLLVGLVFGYLAARQLEHGPPAAHACWPPVYGRVAEQFELEGSVNYADFGDFGDGTNLGIGARYYFTEQFAIGLEGGFGDDANSYGVGFRWQWGN